jgi:hypothetical protein
VDTGRSAKASMGPEKEIPASLLSHDPSAKLSAVYCESLKECKRPVLSTEHSVRMCGENAERDEFIEERFYVFRCDDRPPNEEEPGVKFS